VRLCGKGLHEMTAANTYVRSDYGGARCKACQREYDAAYRAAHRVGRREYDAAYRAAHSDRIAEYKAAWHEARYWGGDGLKHRVERSFRVRRARIAHNKQKRAEQGFTPNPVIQAALERAINPKEILRGTLPDQG
jgi:hypothetical protein